MRDGMFNSAMRNAAVILFVLAILVPIVSLVEQFVILSGLTDNSSLSSYSSGGTRGPIWPLLMALAASLQGAVLPFFGAAVLWRWDLRNARAEAAE